MGDHNRNCRVSHQPKLGHHGGLEPLGCVVQPVDLAVGLAEVVLVGHGAAWKEGRTRHRQNAMVERLIESWKAKFGCQVQSDNQNSDNLCLNCKLRAGHLWFMVTFLRLFVIIF